MKKLSTAILLACVLSLGGCIIITDDGGDASLTIVNGSSYVLEEVYLASIDSPTWGPDLLHGGVLFPGDELIIDYIECDVYDVMVVDETHTECELLNLDLCFSDDVWVIDDRTLARCDFFGR